jgi:serine/threonine-protein kinase
LPTAVLSDADGTGRNHLQEDATELLSAEPSAARKRQSGQDSSERRGRFTILRRHARGGLGKISIARDEDLQREVALKEILPESADDQYNRDRFVNEAMVTGRLEHPGIVPVYALGRDEQGRPYYAMKLVHGKTLHDAIRDYHALPTPLEFRGLLRHFVDVCQAVAFAHSQGVIHRDLKPANVMIGEYGETLVLDWGLAKWRDEAPQPAVPPSESQEVASVLAGLPDRPELTHEGQVLGTPAYMSPEQAGGEVNQLSPASDVYSLGCMLFELLAGRPPFDELATMDLIDRKRIEAPPLPSRIRAGVPRALEAICVKAISRQPEERYHTATDLAKDVERWLADEAVLAFREPLWGRMARWGRRHRPFVVGGVILFLLAFVGLAITNEVIRREKEEKERANLDARIQRDRAMERFRMANETLDVMLKRVGHNRFALVAQMDPRGDPIRFGLLQDVQSFYERFLKDQSREPALRRETALARHRIADILKMRGELLEAEWAYERAIHQLSFTNPPRNVDEGAHLLAERAACQHDLGLLLYVTDRPSEAEKQYIAAQECYQRLRNYYPGFEGATNARLGEARVCHQYALVLRDLGRFPAAEEQFERAASIRQELGELGRADPAVRRAIAQTEIDFSDFLLRRSRPEEAVRRSKHAVELLRELVATTVAASDSPHPDIGDYRHELAGSLNNHALILSANNPLEAELAFREALSIRTALVTDFGLRPDFRFELALCQLNLGVLYFNTKRLSEAERSWTEARQGFERLANDLRQSPIYTSKLGQTLNNLAALKEAAKDLSGARTLLEAAITQQRKAWQGNPRHAEYQSLLCAHYSDLADLLLRQGLPNAAAAAAAELPVVAPASAQESRRAAGLLARCAAAAQAEATGSLEVRTKNATAHADLAMLHLRQAIQRGYKDRADLLQSKDLEFLRSRADFKVLLESLAEAPSQKPPS